MFKCMKYIGKRNACGFKKNHIYNIEIRDRDDGPGILLTSDLDVTEDKDVELYIALSSGNSIGKFFKDVQK